MMDDQSRVGLSRSSWFVWRKADVQDQVNDSDGRDSISSGFGLGVARGFGGR